MCTQATHSSALHPQRQGGHGQGDIAGDTRSDTPSDTTGDTRGDTPSDTTGDTLVDSSSMGDTVGSNL
jgi:hypothetical protein